MCCVCVCVYIHPSGIQFQGCYCFRRHDLCVKFKNRQQSGHIFRGRFFRCLNFWCGWLSTLGFPFPKISTGNCFAHIYSQVIAHDYTYTLLSVVWFHPLESLEERSTPCCPFHHILSSRCLSGAFNAFVRHWGSKMQAGLNVWISGDLTVLTPPISLSSSVPSASFLSEVQAESAKVAWRIVRVDHGRGGDGDEELVAGPELKQSSLVDRVEGVLSIWGPALCPHPLQELHRKYRY